MTSIIYKIKRDGKKIYEKKMKFKGVLWKNTFSNGQLL